jgi:hypothetical protein
MAALIFEKKIVQERTDLNPVTGCWRVVYEKKGEGASFKQLLDGDAKLQTEKRGIVKAVAALVSEPDYIVYAVSKERNLLLEFPERVAHQNNRNYFDLNFKMEYQVADPKVLIERLRVGKDDPLTRLRNTIAGEIGTASGRVAWEIIRDEYAFGEVAEELTAPDSEVFQKIQGKARYLGLEVTGIKVSLRLLEGDLREWKADVERDRTLAQKKRDLEITRVSEDIRDEEAKRHLRRETWKGGAEALTTSLHKIGSDADTAAKLRDNLEVLGSILPQVNVPGPQVASLPERSPSLLLSGANGLHSEALSFLQKIINLITELDLRDRERKRLLSALLHLAGELLAPDETYPDGLAHYREKYETVLEQLLNEMTVQQHETLQLLLKMERL